MAKLPVLLRPQRRPQASADSDTATIVCRTVKTFSTHSRTRDIHPLLFSDTLVKRVPYCHFVFFKNGSKNGTLQNPLYHAEF